LGCQPGSEQIALGVVIADPVMQLARVPTRGDLAGEVGSRLIGRAQL
jgi:hypothetical protein